MVLSSIIARGIGGVTVELSLQEMIVLKDLLQSLQNTQKSLANSTKLSYEIKDIVESNNSKVIALLTKIVGDVKGLGETANDLFTQPVVEEKKFNPKLHDTTFG